MAKGRKTGGRTAGTPNRLTADVKSAIEGAFNAVGGQSYLEGIAKENPAVFCSLLGRVLPRQHEVSIPEPKKEAPDIVETARRIAFIFSEAQRLKRLKSACPSSFA